MSVLLFLIPITLALGLAGLAAFLWCLKNKQYDDLDGAASRILFDEDSQNKPIQKASAATKPQDPTLT